MSDPQIELKRWVKDELDSRGHGFRVQFASIVKISPDMVTKIVEIDSPIAKRRRQIKPHELPLIAKALGKLPPGYEQMTDWLELPGDTPAEDESKMPLDEIILLLPRLNRDDLERLAREAVSALAQRVPESVKPAS